MCQTGSWIQGLRFVEHVSVDVDVDVYWRVRHTLLCESSDILLGSGKRRPLLSIQSEFRMSQNKALGSYTLMCLSACVFVCDRSTARWSHISHPATRWGFVSQPPKDWNLFAQYASVDMAHHDLIRIKPGTCRNKVEPLCLWIKQLSLGKQTIESHCGNVTSPLSVN